jgi:hypothetical protein
VKTGEKIFVFGKPSGRAPGIFSSQPHPKDKKAEVRFVKDVRLGETLFFNMQDFLKPYKNKKYQKVIKNMLPRKHRNLDRVWMNTKAFCRQF